MAFGVIMLLLSCLCAYFYYSHVKGKLDPQLIDGQNSRNAELAAKAAQMRAKVKAQQPKTLSYASVGSFVKMQDVGLKMLSFDGLIKDKHIFKNGLMRWYELDVDQGGQTFPVETKVRDDKFVYVCLKQLDLNDLGLDKEDFYQINQNTVEAIHFEGTVYQFKESLSATFCRSGNELEPEPCLIWKYADPSGALVLSVRRWQDASFSILSQVRVRDSQISLLLNETSL